MKLLLASLPLIGLAGPVVAQTAAAGRRHREMCAKNKKAQGC